MCMYAICAWTVAAPRSPGLCHVVLLGSHMQTRPMCLMKAWLVPKFAVVDKSGCSNCIKPHKFFMIL